MLLMLGGCVRVSCCMCLFLLYGWERLCQVMLGPAAATLLTRKHCSCTHYSKHLLFRTYWMLFCLHCCPVLAFALLLLSLSFQPDAGSHCRHLAAGLGCTAGGRPRGAEAHL
jgi:hypothetical protein